MTRLDRLLPPAQPGKTWTACFDGGEVLRLPVLDVPDENIVVRMSGRRACPNCGATYHIVNIPPKKEGICDTCGSELIQRADDKAETVKKRLDVYHEATEPLIKFYKGLGVLYTVDGTKPMSEVFADIVKILED